MRSIKYFVVVACMMLSVSIFAADPAPLVMLKSTTSQMLKELDKNIGNLKNNDKLVYDLVNRVLVPHFDQSSMASAVIGMPWRSASDDLKQQFIQEFAKYVIRTYSAALQSYDGERIKFFPIRGAIGSRVQVNSDLLLKHGPPIQIQYRLQKQGGKWLIYDFSVDGVSIIKNYRAQFAKTLRTNGLSGLVRQLKRNNSVR